MIPEEIKYIICEYVSQTWVNEAIWLFPSLKNITKKIPTHLMYNSDIKKDKLRRKTVTILAKRLVKMKRGKDRHYIFFNKLGYDEIQKYCDIANSRENTIPEKLIQIRPAPTELTMFSTLSILCYPILCLGYVYSMNMLSECTVCPVEIPYLFIDNLSRHFIWNQLVF